MSNQGARQASVRAVTGTAYPYEGDWHALFDMAGIPVGTYNERLLAWINDYLGTSYTNVNDAMAAFAIDNGVSSWNELGTFDAESGPTFSGSLVSSTLPTGLTFTRASTKTMNVNGVLTDYAINAYPGNIYDGYLPEGPRTNSIRNGEAQGSVAGSPGTLPSNWNDVNTVGLTRTIVGAGTINGFNYLDIRLSGTPLAGTYELLFDGASQIAAASGQKWTGSFYIGLIAGSLTGITSVNVRVSERAAGVEVAGSSQAIVPTIDPTRISVIRTLNNVGTTNVISEMTAVVTAVAIDATFRIACAQVELGYGATSYIRTTTVAATRAQDVLSIATSGLGGFNASAGTLVLQARAAPFYDAGATSQCALSFATGGDYITMTRFAFGSGRMLIRLVDNFSDVGNVPANPALTANTDFKCAQAWALNDLAICLNGGSVSTNLTMPSMPTVNTLYIGMSDTGFGEHFNGFIRQFDYYNIRKTNSELVTLSA